MDEAITQLLNIGTAVFAVAIVVVTFFIRRGIETAWPSLRKKADENAPNVSYSTTASRWYQQVLLYAIPVVVGVGLGLLDVPLLVPEDLRTLGGRIFYGMVSGWFSSATYKVIKRLFSQKGIELPSASISPSAPSGPPSGPSA
jgi:hypothetical protein